MDRVRIAAEDDGFLISVHGTNSNALIARRLVSQLSNDPPGEPEAPVVSYRVPKARLKSVVLALAPHLARSGLKLERDAAVAAVIGEVGQEIGLLRVALEGKLKPASFSLSAGFRRELREHQRLAVAKLLALPHGANFSVPGAGKTTVTLALHDVLRQQGRVGQLLVVAPRNAFRPWEEEIADCYQSPPRVVRLAGGGQRIAELLRDPRNGDAVLLLSYQQAYFALETLERWLSSQDKLHIVLDESHKIKNPRRGAWATTALRFASLATRRDILTGTPAPNAIEDLGTQLAFLWPFQTILSDADLKNPSSEQTVTNRLRPLFVRTTKKDLGLPKTETLQVPVAMGELQREIHDHVAHRVARAAGAHRTVLRSDLLNLRAHVIRLLQLASNPALVLSEAEEFRIPPLDLSEDRELEELFARYHEFEIPPKFTYAVKRVQERAAAGQKTIVWSSFVRNLEMLAGLLRDYNPVVLHGGVPTALDIEEAPENTREELVDRFKTEQSCRVMIANPAACGESISLHRACDFALYLDRTFNAASFLQSMDRIHRLGLKKTAKVRYELLVSPGTIDEVVDRRLAEKIRLLGRLLDDDALRTVDLDSVDEASPVAFDLDDARQVVAFLSERLSRERS